MTSNLVQGPFKKVSSLLAYTEGGGGQSYNFKPHPIHHFIKWTKANHLLRELDEIQHGSLY